MSARVVSKQVPSPESTVVLKDVIRLSDNRKIIYEIKPDLKVQLKTGYRHAAGVTLTYYPLRTNSKGERCDWESCREYEAEKAEGVGRIIGIGDSVMYGDQVGYSDAYLSVLEDMLNKAPEGKRWEAINHAVFGYNTVMEVESFKEKGLQYDPDIVIVGYCYNDFDLPDFVRNEEDYYTLGKSFLVEFIGRRLGIIAKKMNTGVEFKYRDFEGGDPSRVPSPYRDMVGGDAFKKALSELRALSLKHDFKVAVVFFTSFFGTPTGRDVIDLCSELGFTVIDVEPIIGEYMDKNNIENYLGSELSASRYDPHPSPLLHKMAAEEIFRQLAEKGVINAAL